MSPGKIGASVLNAVLNFIYPAICGNCESLLQEEERLFCKKCWTSVQPIPVYSPEELTAAKVWDNLPLTKTRSLWLFDSFMQTVIHEMKYKRKLSIAKRLGAEMAIAVQQDKDFAQADLLIPVPLHKSKQRERGYNQSLLLAKSIAYKAGIPVGTKIIKRSQKTQAQAKLNAEQRMRNVKDAFELVDGKELTDVNIILVDDVCTTGATLFACADVLLQAGCGNVYALTVAKAPDFEQDSAA